MHTQDILTCSFLDFLKAGLHSPKVGLIKKSLLWLLKISLTNIHDTIIPKILPWIIKEPAVILKLNKFFQNKNHTSTYQDKLHNVITTSASLLMAPRTMIKLHVHSHSKQENCQESSSKKKLYLYG